MTKYLKSPRTPDVQPLTKGAMVATLILSLGTLASVLWPVQAAASQALVQSYACVGCHQANARVVGPSWKDISQKYGDGKATAEQIASSIKAGSTGKWGSIPMPPQAQVSDADLKSIAQWLLDGAQ
ncbi:c-type cytochrome [Pseudomonas nunensis]|uniref:c-type cytochrome n=1 Tax=Pseudomonas nunensis TaxID=2961896 RepID=UPI0025B0AE60|nr:c-type cytochrome [Pseudomonas nunensis]MDN3221457.1 c-type cytochrome [Pseudomonas nunensis]